MLPLCSATLTRRLVPPALRGQPPVCSGIMEPMSGMINPPPRTLRENTGVYQEGGVGDKAPFFPSASVDGRAGIMFCFFFPPAASRCKALGGVTEFFHVLFCRCDFFFLRTTSRVGIRLALKAFISVSFSVCVMWNNRIWQSR